MSGYNETSLRKADLSKIAFLSDYFPRRCGIATFARDLRTAVARAFPDVSCQVVAVTDPHGNYNYPSEVSFEVRQQSLPDYTRAAEFLQFQAAQCVCVQHEFGIYGGEAGAHLLAFLRGLRLPVVTTCHTLLEEPDAAQRRVFLELAELSQRLVAMSERGRRILRETYRVSDDRIAVIPHGIPDVPFIDPSFYKDQYGVEGRKLLLTFGLLSPGKGLEYAVRAMPKIVAAHPEAVYIVLGATHPHLARREGEAYRNKLEQLARDLGVEEHVLFFNRFVSQEELTEFLGACDIYLTPYLHAAQITSGTLAYAFGCGKAVVSTPYWHAEELLANGRGSLVPFRDAEAMADAVIHLLDDENARSQMRKEAYVAGRSTIWPRVAESYMKVFREARLAASRQSLLPLGKKRALERMQFPEIRLDHARRLTDSTGIFQHGTYSFPNFSEGYCLDDNARALILVCRLEGLQRESAAVADLSSVYAAFVDYAFNPETGRFRNFMSFERRWLEETGSEDAHGRALWALGVCVGRSPQRPLQNWALNLFERALPAILDTTSPRAWAFALLGLDEFLRRMGGQRQARAAREQLARRLLGLFRAASSREWQWFEPVLSYDNATFAHALIVSGRAMQDAELRDVGLRSLAWLMEQQTAGSSEEPPANAEGLGAQLRGDRYFSPIGSEGFHRQGGPRAEFDQQPLEAQASVAACLDAYVATRDESWLEEALRAFRWFLGSNKLGEQVYDHETGGCRDGLHVDRVNQNEGAESTISFLLALTDIKAHEAILSSIHAPAEKAAVAPAASVSRNQARVAV